MTNAQSLENARNFLKRWFTSKHPSNPWNISESIMINEGFYCGRKFAFGPYTAIWFVEENQIKVFNPDGSVAHSASSEELTPSENAAEIRRAA